MIYCLLNFSASLNSLVMDFIEMVTVSFGGVVETKQIVLVTRPVQRKHTTINIP
jgi:hypothetical protein